MPNYEKLSEKDRAVLRSIFDPSLTIGETVEEEESFMDADEEAGDVDSGERAHARQLEARAVRLAESAGGRQEALRLLDEAVALAGAAHAHNNRAQLLRLLARDDEAMSDLEEALSKTTGQRTRVRAQALCQRGLLLRKRGQDGAARRDFTEAAGLGSVFAKKQVAEMNPYAALCNQMLQQVMKGETELKIQHPSQS